MKSAFSLENRVIIITGASSGIGKQCAISCSQMGAKVVLIARNEERLQETISQLDGKEHIYSSLDITRFDEIENTVKEAVNKVGKIDGFIHSAGIEKTLPLRIMKPEYYQEMFNINVVAGFEIAKILSKKKYRKGCASFVFISSIMSVVANSGLIGYCATKGAINSGVREMAVELARKKIRVNSVSPAHLSDTEMSSNKNQNIGKDALKKLEKMHPLGLGSKEDVANACIYLLSDASRWVTGTNLIVDGGYSAK
jgi:NAD(P)-dependent dehydrogenase (short-subunit alcohol dehydrogenase family)